MDAAGIERVRVIAQELEAAGRRSDAELLAQLASEAEADVEPALSDHELDRRLAEAEADIDAGRVTLNEDMWAAIAATAASGQAFFGGIGRVTALNPDAEPIKDISELKGDFWPEDEGPDDFVNALRQWRREG